jgi:hypothetical protein
MATPKTMGKVYKDKKSNGCALCKPHKHGWAPKKKVKERAAEMETTRPIGAFLHDAEEKESA